MCEYCAQGKEFESMEQNGLKQITRIVNKSGKYFLVNAIVPKSPMEVDDADILFSSGGLRAAMSVGWGLKIDYCPKCGENLKGE